MSSELDLRGVHQPHEPDPGFVEALEQRLGAILIGAAGGDPAIDDAELLDLSLPATRRARRRWVGRAVLGAAAAIVLVAVAVTVRRNEPAVETPMAPIITPRPNGWVAQGYGVAIWVSREDGTGHVVDYPGDAGGAEACPAFSPDGERLMFGARKASASGSIEVLSVAPGGAAVSLLRSIPLDGLNSLPCPIWAPDGRWAAFGSDGAAWIVDTETAEVRRLPGYRPTDLEWRPGTDQLAIIGRATPGSDTSDNGPIDIYAVSSGEVRTIGDVEASELTWSPDGTTIAYTSRPDPGDPNVKSGITLIDADGTNPRPLTTDSYVADHGIGVVWSPRGDLIAYQRARADCTGAACNEVSEVVLVTATDTDPTDPIGTERAVPPVVDNLDIESFRSRYNGLPPFDNAPWYADSVTWSPDGTKLLYSAGRAGLLTVPVDATQPVFVISGDSLIRHNEEGAVFFPWLPLQQWQPAP